MKNFCLVLLLLGLVFIGLPLFVYLLHYFAIHFYIPFLDWMFHILP